MRRTATFLTASLLIAGACVAVHVTPFPIARLAAQGNAPAAPLTLISRDGRRTVPTTVQSGQELIGLDDIATLFQAPFREDPLAGGVTISYRGRTIVATADQSTVSVNGRIVTLPSPVLHAGRRWLVPVEFLSRALAPIYDQRIELRRPQRLLLVGDVRVPRVTARIDTPGPPTRALIDIAPQAMVTAMTDAGRVLLHVDADALDLALPSSGGGLIDQIRAGDQPTTVTLVMAGAAATPRITQSNADGVTHVVVDVPSGTSTQTAPPTGTPPQPATTPESPLSAVRTGFQTVVIDPGHGADDVGATGAGGLQEKAVTLDIAHRLRALIESRLGLRVILTRDDDHAVALDARAAVANNSKADLFLSLHVNAALSPMLKGAEIYHLKLDPEGERIRREAQADAVTLPVLGGGSRQLEVIRWDMAQARHVAESAMFATMLSEELGKQVPLSPRAVQQAPMRVLEGADTPAALVEMFYATNAEQGKAAAGDEFRNALAQGLFDAVARFRTWAEEHRR